MNTKMPTAKATSTMMTTTTMKIGNMNNCNDFNEDGGNESSDDDIDRLMRQDPTLTSIVLGSSSESLQKYLSTADEVDGAMRKNKCLKTVCFHERLITDRRCYYRSMTSSRRLRSIWEAAFSIPTIEVVEIQRLCIENHHDVRILAKPLYDHPTLRRLKISEFTVHLSPSASAAPGLGSSSSCSSSTATVPLLEPLIEAASSIPNLELLHVKCHADYFQLRKGSRSYVSTIGLRRLLSSSEGGKKLKSLALSNLKLGDEEFECISRCFLQNKKKTNIVDVAAESNVHEEDEDDDNDGDHSGHSQSQSSMTELILNDNLNTEIGSRCILATLLTSLKFIERLDVYNTHRVGPDFCGLLLEILKAGPPTIKHIRVNTVHQHDREQIQFYTLLNRCGRKFILDPQTPPHQVIAILSKMTTASLQISSSSSPPSMLGTSSMMATASVLSECDVVSVIWHFIRDRPTLLQN